MKIKEICSGEVLDVEAASRIPRGVQAVRDGRRVWIHYRGETYLFERAPDRPRGAKEEVEHDLFAPMPGKVIKIIAKLGDVVEKGAPLLLLEAMKMEHEIRAPRRGVVAKIFPAEGSMVGLGEPLLELGDEA
jgi:3-methylcrotonyl-CoA carboxylase alpha subunit